MEKGPAPSTLRFTFYGIILLTVLGLVLFVFYVADPNNDTANEYENQAMPVKRPPHSETVRENLTEKVVILYWTHVFGAKPTINNNPESWPFFYAGNNCPITCELTNDRSRVHEANALVVHARNTHEMPPKIHKDLTWILHTNENPVFSASLQNPSIMGMFNYLASYRLDSDFPCTEFVKPSLAPPVSFAEKTGLVIAAFSHCEPVRTEYLRRLMKYITVDSYGGCLHNIDNLEAKSKATSRYALTQVQRKYKFSIIFPNADCDYYMTEKIYSALTAGSVPVWMGTDKIDEVLKWGNLQHSVIKVKDFSTPEKLAAYLSNLAKNETGYSAYLKWKYEGFKFPREYYKSPIGQWWDGLPLYCRVCLKVREDPRGHDGLPVDRCDGAQRRTLAKWIRN